MPFASLADPFRTVPTRLVNRVEEVTGTYQKQSACPEELSSTRPISEKCIGERRCEEANRKAAER